MANQQPPSERTTVRRGANRADYDRSTVKAVLGAGLIAHVGVGTEDGPIVLPMAYGFDDDNIYIHGAVGNAMMRAGKGLDVCITVTLVDGLVVSRTPFHNSMNYRSVVVRGEAHRIDDRAEQERVLKIINDHLASLWDITRPPSEAEYKKTMVLSVPLTEASAKIRTGDPIDDEEDLNGPWWAGVVPLVSTWGEPYAAENLKPGIDVPAEVLALPAEEPR